MHNALKFLDAYRKEDFEIYFGREDESELLYQKVHKSRLTLLYGLSGTGKTSLIQCGLANKFSPGDWLDIYIRRGSEHSILKATRQALRDTARSIVHGEDELPDIVRKLYLDYFRPVYLIYDQFEELFIYGNDKEKQEFVDFLKAVLMREDPMVTFILILREEYFVHLDEFEDKINILYDSRLRLEKIRGSKLEKVVRRILRKSDIDGDDHAMANLAKKIIAILKTPGSGDVELPYLQVYLGELFDETKENSVVELDKVIDKNPRLGDVLQDFLENQVNIIAREVNCSPAYIWKLLKSLISVDNTKQGVYLEAIEKYMNDE